MSRNNRNDNSYATYATYNGNTNTTKSDIIMERYSNAPNPNQAASQSQQFYQGNQHPPQVRPPPNGSNGINNVGMMNNGMNNGMNGMSNNKSMPQPPPPSPNVAPLRQDENEIDDSEELSRVKRISPAKLYELLTNSQHFFVQKQQPLRLFVKVYTDWCKPCRKIEPFIKHLSSQPDYYNILFLELNGDELIQDDKLASKLRVSAVPTFYGFVAGQSVGSVAGIVESEIQDLCNKISSL